MAGQNFLSLCISDYDKYLVSSRHSDIMRQNGGKKFILLNRVCDIRKNL